MAVAVTVLASSGALKAPVEGLPDPGTLVRWGLPAAAVARDASAALTIGLLVAAAVLLPGPGPAPRATTTPTRTPTHTPTHTLALGPTLTSAQRRAVRLGGYAAASWAVAGLAGVILSYADLAGAAVNLEVLAGIPLFVTEFDLGRALGLSVLGSLLACATAIAARRPGQVGVAAGLAVAAVLPLAWTGHAAGTLNHAAAVDLQMFHLVGVTLWVGGLAAVALTRRALEASFPLVVTRFSTLAGWCFGIVAVSGIVGASVRLGSWAALVGTGYGTLLVAKATALIALGIAGWCHRRWLLGKLTGPTPGRIFARLAAGELFVMAVAVGLAVALSRTSPLLPGSSGPPLEPTTELLGYPMPPPLTAVTAFTAWRVDTLWLPLTAAAAFWYLRAVLRLRRRGDRWPWGRTAAFLLGCAAMIIATSGSPGVYGQVLFSMHMVQHMSIATAVPVFLVLGAPLTLALRSLPRRVDGSRGPREWLLAMVHSAPARLLSHPLVAAAIFLSSLVVFYYSAAFEVSLRSHAGHVLMIAHFLLAGYLFANVICGIDPGPSRPPHLFRLLLLMLTFGYHAFFAVALMSGSQILGSEWYRLLHRDWGPTLAEDQNLGAALSWALGDYPIAVLAVALFVSWISTDTRAARRHDRQADRDGDADLAAYNRSLHDLQIRHKPTHDQELGRADE
ncbi:MAG TPA: cytochrome c oxidase assembly protein [Microlunatus sp.]